MSVASSCQELGSSTRRRCDKKQKQKKTNFPFQQLGYSERKKETNVILTFLHGNISYCHFHPILCWRYSVTSNQQDPVHINPNKWPKLCCSSPQKILCLIWFVYLNRKSSFITFANLYFSENTIYPNENLIIFPGMCERTMNLTLVFLSQTREGKTGKIENDINICIYCYWNI